MNILIKLTVDINFPIFLINFFVYNFIPEVNNGSLDCIHVTTCTCFRNIFCHLVKCFDRDKKWCGEDFNFSNMLWCQSCVDIIQCNICVVRRYIIFLGI